MDTEYFIVILFFMLVKIGLAFVRISQSEEDNGLYHREHGGMP
ncbi:hypothetical protein HMPREF1989_01111 [Porphyromonas gingivalis F0566]|nr:hypothetical protein HMPREF1989_01111 [Porphyromonas gingivalis F0566]